MWHFFYSGPRFATVHSHTVVHQSRHEAVRPTGRIKSEKNVEIFFKKKNGKSNRLQRKIGAQKRKNE
jgi:hypothetical protein